MKERPILMSAPMVIATLENRKLQTRRIASWPIMSKSDGAKKRVFLKEDLDLVNTLLREKHRDPMRIPSCRYGRIGDRLWVRETWEHRAYGAIDDVVVRYIADGQTEYMRVCEADKKYRTGSFKRKPSIFMPRWASRINLEITDVRVQRLQDISEEDAKAEGVESPEFERYDHDFKICPQCGGTRLYTYHSMSGAQFDSDCMKCNTHKKRYRWLWESINGPGSWDLNPFVWVVSYRKI